MTQPELRVPAESLLGPWQRLRGLIGRRAPQPGQAVWISPCRQVHTLFMGYSIDVVHLGLGGEALSVQTLAPWRLGRFVWRSVGVLEMAAGEAQRLGIYRSATVALIAQ